VSALVKLPAVLVMDPVIFCNIDTAKHGMSTLGFKIGLAVEELPAPDPMGEDADGVD